MNNSIKLNPGNMYHIYHHANGSENLFNSKDNYFYFLDKYSEKIYPIADTIAYCLMPNHFHFMLRIKSESELKDVSQKEFSSSIDIQNYLSQQFSNLFNGYTQAYNKMYKRTGSLFRQNFKRKEVLHNNQALQLIVYIHSNPVKHGFCKNIIDWEFSSIHSYLSQKNSKVNKMFGYHLGTDKDSILEFHRNTIVNPLLFDI